MQPSSSHPRSVPYSSDSRFPILSPIHRFLLVLHSFPPSHPPPPSDINISQTSFIQFPATTLLSRGVNLGLFHSSTDSQHLTLTPFLGGLGPQRHLIPRPSDVSLPSLMTRCIPIAPFLPSFTATRFQTLCETDIKLTLCLQTLHHQHEFACRRHRRA